MITIILLLPVTLAIASHVKGPRVAGVNQVSSIDGSHRLQYAFNASQAREVCLSLGLTIASKAEVQSALTRGFQTCRFGWIDEHFAVIPRVTAKVSCGQGKTGLVEWRANVTKHFDVFCFNESDAGTQLKDTTSDSPLTDYQAPTRSPPSQQDTTLTSDPTFSPSSSSHSVSGALSSLALLRLTQSRAQAQPGLFLSTQVPTKTLLIGITCALLLVITAVFGLEKLNHSCFQKWDMEEQGDSMEAKESMCVMYIQEHVQDGCFPTEEESGDRNRLHTTL